MDDGFKNNPELKKKLEKWDKNKPINKQTQALEDIADMVQDLLTSLADENKGKKAFFDDLGPLLLDMRASLTALKDKDDIKVPDFAKPVITQLKRLEKALSRAVEARQPVEVSVNAPEVHVAPPDVDLKGVEEIFKELPKAFEEAIKAIPDTPEWDWTPLQEQFADLQGILQSIDTATRMKVQFPNVMRVTTTDPITTQVTSYDCLIAVDSGDSNITYIGKAVPGTATSAASWQIKEVDETTGTEVRYADGDADFDNVWNNRESLSY